MKKTTKIIKIILTTILFISISSYGITASAADTSISGKTSLNPNQSSTIAIKLGGSSEMEHGFTITSSNTSVISFTPNNVSGFTCVGNSCAAGSGSYSMNIVAGSEGSATITLVGKAEHYLGDEFSYSKTMTITVKKPVNKPTPEPKPDPKPKPPVVDNTENDKKPVVKPPSITKEEQEKIDEEKRKRELEEQKKIPLIEGVEIYSASDKMNGFLLETVKFINSDFTGTVQLPRKINDIEVRVISGEDVKLTFEEKVSLNNVETYEYKINASKGEINQSYSIQISKDNTPEVIRQIDAQSLFVYDEPSLTQYFKKYGFNELSHNKDNVGLVLSNDHINFQVLVDSDYSVYYYLLDDELAIIEELSLIEVKENELFFVKNFKSEKGTIRNIKNTLVLFDGLISLDAVDNSLKNNDSIYAWDLEEGLVVEGYTDQKNENIFIVEEDSINRIIVGFDEENPSKDILTLTLAVAFTSLALTNMVYITVRHLKKKKYSQYIN